MNSLVLQYLEKSVLKYGDKSAFIDENTSITFEQTKQFALSVSDEIINKIGYKNNSPILVFLPKSVQAIVSMLGVVYSGNFYTPTSVGFPKEKIKSLVDALKPTLIVTNTQNIQKLLDIGVDEDICICYDKIDPKKDIDTLKSNTKNAIDTDLVYTYFTSGSTGVPKGVTICHKNIVNYIEGLAQTIQISSDIKIANQTPLYFDLSVQDLYITLRQGATLFIIPEKLFSFPIKLVEYLIENEINFIFWVPSVFTNIFKYKALKKFILDKMKILMFCGEVMPVKHLNYFLEYAPNLETIINAYGPTEATISCTYFHIDGKYDESKSLPLGYPTKNTRIYLFDEEEQLISSPNKKGELCVLGSTVALGYYQNTEKTKEVFVQNPSHNDYRDIMYRTGDLAMYDDEGLLIFCGRKDNQIKHLGYRIELGEIETAVLSLDEVNSCMTFYDEDKRRITLVYSSVKDGFTQRDLKLALGEILPKYMVPTKYHELDVLPVNANGKIDRVLLKNKFI